MPKKIILTIIILFAVFQLKAQTEKNICSENYSLYREFIKINLYDFALPYWKKSFTDCPSYNKNIYIDGVKIYRNYLKNSTDEITKNEYTDTLIMIYNQRIKYFGEEGYIYGRIGTDLSAYSTTDDQIILAQQYLKRSIELKKENSEAQVFYTYFKNSQSLLNNNIITLDKYLEIYLEIQSLLNKVEFTEGDDLYKIDNYVRKNIGNINTVPEIFSDSINLVIIENYKQPSDYENIVYFLEELNCTNNSLYENTLELMKQSSSEENSILRIARLFSSEKNYQKSIKFFYLAAELENNDSLKAQIYYEMAVSESCMYDYSAAFKFAKKAIELNENFGKAYLLIALIFAQSVDYYSYNEFEKAAVYWFAVDKLEKAKTVDPSLSETADKQISYYSFFFPTRELCFWYSIYEGDNYTINSWFSETTTARYNN